LVSQDPSKIVGQSPFQNDWPTSIHMRATIVQSSGMSKSHLLDELSKSRFMIPTNLRKGGSTVMFVTSSKKKFGDEASSHIHRISTPSNWRSQLSRHGCGDITSAWMKVCNLRMGWLTTFSGKQFSQLRWGTQRDGMGTVGTH